MDRIHEHALYHALREDLTPAFKEGITKMHQAIAETKSSRVQTPATLSPREHYSRIVFTYYLRSVSALERLTDTQTYILNFPKHTAFKEKGITHDKWIEYHYCNYLITLSGLYDIAIILTGAVFRTGIDPKHCNDKTILENQWIKSTPVKPALKALHKAIEPHKRDRNAYIHHGEVPIIEPIDELKTFSFIEHVGAAERIGLDVKILSDAYTEAVGEITDGMQPKVEEVVDATARLFDALLPFYSGYARALTPTRRVSEQ